MTQFTAAAARVLRAAAPSQPATGRGGPARACGPAFELPSMMSVTSLDGYGVAAFAYGNELARISSAVPKERS
ncbi:hypothetical protein Acsp04_31140 [Actinomadura sp. NBRC 104425]|nr:hypothetical protein Acsp04_31140 [Actinomadura sp. NBRC 104425]